MDIAYFVQELSDPAVRRRILMLGAAGADLRLLGFERGRHGRTAVDADAPPIILGRTRGGRFLHRIASIVAAAPRVWAARSAWARADVVIARNLETLVLVSALAGLAGFKGRLVYECLDIHRLMLRADVVGGVLRAVERACLARASLILTSSPAFVERYFRERLGTSLEILVVENKVLALDHAGEEVASLPEPPVEAAPPGQPPWIIAWCGVVRCRRSFELLAGLPDTLKDRVRVEIWGAPALDQIPDFHEVVAARAHMAFHGRYAAEDLARIYGDAHFAWAVDYYEAGGNSDWLLPNRLYESASFGAVPIAVEGVETARWLERCGVGVILRGDPLAALNAFLQSCSSETHASLREAVMGLDRSATTLSTDEAKTVLAALTGAAPAS